MKLRQRLTLWYISKRDLRHSQSGRVSMENVALALVIAGALVALFTLFAALFVPSTTWTVLDSELGAAVGILLVIFGGVAHAAD